jgi:ligand-binding sensor domain-containing protein
LVYEDRQNRLFVAALGGLVERRGDNFARVFGPKEMGEQTAGSMIEDPAGSIWIGGGRGILRRTARFECSTLATACPIAADAIFGPTATAIFGVGTSGGMSRLEGRRFVITPFDSSHDVDVRFFFEDREANL